MKLGVTVKNVEAALKSIEKEVQKREQAFHAGLIAAGLELERLATLQITSTLYSTPEPETKARKRTGNLRASRYTVWTQGPMKGAPGFNDANGEAAAQEQAFQNAVSTSKSEVDARSKDTFAVVVGYGASYALYVHEGTSRMSGYHWLSDALNTNKQHLIDIVHTYAKDAKMSMTTGLTSSGGL